MRATFGSLKDGWRGPGELVTVHGLYRLTAKSLEECTVYEIQNVRKPMALPVLMFAILPSGRRLNV